MPFESEKQRRLMYAAAHNPDIAKKRDIPQSVAKEMISHDNDIHNYMDAVRKGDSNMMSTISKKLTDGY